MVSLVEEVAPGSWAMKRVHSAPSARGARGSVQMASLVTAYGVAPLPDQSPTLATSLQCSFLVMHIKSSGGTSIHCILYH